MNQVRTISTSIDIPVSVVYDFIAEPSNLPRWSFFVRSAKRDGDVWQVATQGGVALMRFVGRNDFGVVDHRVRSETGAAEIYVPLRVVANGHGSEVMFTVFRLPEMDDTAFENDVALVQKDLANLKSVLESGNADPSRKRE